MWCINCGTKLPDEAKFCFSCGAKVVNIVSDNEVEETYDLEEDNNPQDSENLMTEQIDDKRDIVVDNDVELVLFDRKLIYKQSDKINASIERFYSKLIKKAKEDFINRFDNQYKTLGSLIDNAEDNFNNDLYRGVMMIKELVTMASGQEVDINELYDSLTEDCYEFSKIIYDADEFYNKVMGQVDASKSYRDQRKKYRGRWEGGGFGVSGAIKGAVTAGAMNATTGVLHSLVNGIGNIANNYQANKAIEEYYKNPMLKESLITAIEKDLETLKGLAIQFIEAFIGIKVNTELFNLEKQNKSIDVYNKLINDHIPSDKLEENIVTMLSLYPLDEDYYYAAFKIYGDKIQGINEFAIFFGVPLDKVRAKLKEEKEYEEALVKKLGDARELLQRDLGQNLIFEREAINFTNNLVTNVSYAYKYIDNDRLSFIYNDIDPETEKAFNMALENYLDYNDETPLVFFNNSTSNSKSEGFVITNKDFITHDNNMKKINISINDIHKVSLEGKNLKINSTLVNTYMILNDESELFRQIIEYTIFTIKHNKLLNSGNEIIVKDKLNLKDKYFHYKDVTRAELEKKLGQATGILENKLKKNRVYNEYKSKTNPVSKLDVKSIAGEYKGDNLYFIDDEITTKVIDKLNNVYSTYAKEKQNNEIEYILFDNTIWGGAKEGFLVTSEYIYIHNAYEEGFRIKLSDIKEVLYKDDDLYINGLKVSILQVSNEEKHNFKNIVEYILYRIKYRLMINPSDLVVNDKDKLDDRKENTISSIVSEDMMKEIKLIKTEFDYVVYIKKYISTSKIKDLCDRIYVNGESPSAAAKFNNALSAYLRKVQGEFPCVIYDDTLFGSAKDGFALTCEAIHFRNSGEEPVRINYTDIINIRPDGSYLIIGRNRINLSFVSKDHMKDFAEAITSLIEVIKTIKATCFNNI